MPAVAVTPPAGRSFATSRVAFCTEGVPGVPVVPPVMTYCVLSTPPLYASATATGATVTVMLRVPVQAPASVAVTTTSNVPVWLGVPDTWPLDALMLRPPGRPVADQVIVPLPPTRVNVTGVIAVLNVRAGIVPLTVITGQTTLNVNGFCTASGGTPLLAVIVHR